VEKKTHTKKEQTISQAVIENISTQLELFEKNQEFLSTEVTLSSLAKVFETNSKYLSQVINQQKEQSFNNYINSLRINYTVEKLKTDLIFRKYSIKAIANEVGFNTTESFSKAFFKNTGIRPSFFIKELDN
jgi:YesN/AraC family two-component response regulator